MPAPALVQTREGQYSVLQADLPGRGLVNVGVLLVDAQRDALYVRLRRDLSMLAEEDDLDVLEALADDLDAKAREMGAEQLLDYLENTLSATLQITDRRAVMVEDFDRALGRLYRENVRSEVLQFRTHLPLYTLRAAAGRFLDNEEIVEEAWVEAPEALKQLYPDMFVARIVGRSMEPLIADGSLCVFRADVTGSRSGRLVLAEDRNSNAFAVKRYQSEKVQTEEGWRHERIRLESLNPGYPSWDLDPDENKYRIVAEFVRVLD